MNLTEAYQILGVKFLAPLPLVRKAYKSLATQTHPDKCKTTKPAGDEPFLRIKSAYAYIKTSGLEKTAQPKSDANSKPLHQPEPNEFDLQLTLDEILTGVIRHETITINVVDAGGIERTETKTLEVTVKPGTLPGSRLLLKQDGDCLYGKIPANVIFIVRELPHPHFKRTRFDLLYVARLSAAEACNGHVTIPSLSPNGTKLKLSFDQVIMDNSVERIPGRGLPIPDGKGARGHLVIKFVIIKGNICAIL